MDREQGYYWVWNVNNPKDMVEIALWWRNKENDEWWFGDGYGYEDDKYIRILEGPLTPPVVPEDMT